MVIEVHLRTLQGATLCARMAEGCTVADLQSCLKQQHSIKRATLYIQGHQLQPETQLSTLGLGPGVFVVVVPQASKGEARKRRSAATQQPSNTTAAAAAAAAAAGDAARQQLQQGDTHTEDDLAAQQLDSLLPGYVSRPNPSPLKPALTSRLGQQQQQQQDVRDSTPAEQQAGRGSKRAKTLLQQHLEQQAQQQQQQQQQQQVEDVPIDQQEQQEQKRVGLGGAPDYAAMLAMQPAPAEQQQQEEGMEEEEEGCMAAGLQDNGGPASAPDGSDEEHSESPTAPTDHPPAAAARPKPQRRQKQAASKGRCSSGAAQGPTAAQLPWPSRLLDVHQVERKEGAALLALQLPGVLQELLGSFSRLNLAYAVLLQQRVLPRWAALRSACKASVGLRDLLLLAHLLPHTLVLQHHQPLLQQLLLRCRGGGERPGCVPTTAAAAAAAGATGPGVDSAVLEVPGAGWYTPELTHEQGVHAPYPVPSCQGATPSGAGAISSVSSRPVDSSQPCLVKPGDSSSRGGSSGAAVDTTCGGVSSVADIAEGIREFLELLAAAEALEGRLCAAGSPGAPSSAPALPGASAAADGPPSERRAAAMEGLEPEESDLQLLHLSRLLDDVTVHLLEPPKHNRGRSFQGLGTSFPAAAASAARPVEGLLQQREGAPALDSMLPGAGAVTGATQPEVSWYSLAGGRLHLAPHVKGSAAAADAAVGGTGGAAGSGRRGKVAGQAAAERRYKAARSGLAAAAYVTCWEQHLSQQQRQQQLQAQQSPGVTSTAQAGDTTSAAQPSRKQRRRQCPEQDQEAGGAEPAPAAGAPQGPGEDAPVGRRTRRRVAEAAAGLPSTAAAAQDDEPPVSATAAAAAGEGGSAVVADSADDPKGNKAGRSSRAVAAEADPLDTGEWPGVWELSGVTLPDVLTAVAHHRSRLDQHRHKQQQQTGQQETAPSTDDAASGQRAMAGVPAGVVARPPRLATRCAPCRGTQPLTPRKFLQHLQELPWYQDQLVHVEHRPGRAAVTGTPTTPLSPAVQAALAARGVQQLYSHQVEALDHLLVQRRHLVICTATASGKSLCYNVPVMETLARDPGACALYMFPTKALTQDQLRALRGLLGAAFGDAAPPVEVYDGDTPQDLRPGIRSRAQLLLTNPDMLHQSILPFHPTFARFLSKLAYVVIDEAHFYRGVFGCHVALVLRRLQRLCQRVYHSLPLFVLTSATIANPQQHAQQLLGVEGVAVIQGDGSPHGSKDFVLWNPPLTEEAKRALAEAHLQQQQQQQQEASRASMAGEAQAGTPAEGASTAAAEGGGHSEADRAAQLAAGSQEDVLAPAATIPPVEQGDASAAAVVAAAAAAAPEAAAAGALGQGPVRKSLMTRTEARGGGARLTRRAMAEAARVIAREGIAARRRGLLPGASPPAAAPGGAAAAAATSPDGDWLAGVHLSKAAGAAKRYLFSDRPQQFRNPQELQALLHPLSAGQGGPEAAAEVPATSAVANGDGLVGADGSKVAADAAAAGSKAKQRELADTATAPGLSAAAAATAAGATAAAEEEPAESLQGAAAAGAVELTTGAPPTPLGRKHVPGHSSRGSKVAGDKPQPSPGTVAAALAAVVAAAGGPGAGGLAGGGVAMPRMLDTGNRCIGSSWLAGDRGKTAAAAGPTHPGSSAAPAPAPNPFATATAGRLQLAPEVQAKIQASLPPRGSFVERYGAAGTTLDQRRTSSIVEMAMLLAEAVQHGLRTIAFCKSRKLCELVTAYTRETLKVSAPALCNMVKVYRAGYSPAERRQMEADLHSGALTALAATNALELGIDVGSLDLTLHLGFPGSVSSLWQQSGRAGRREQHSLSLLVGFDGPLDQHFMRHPGELFGRPIECALLDPGNALILRQHLACAAAELVLMPDLDGPLFGGAGAYSTTCRGLEGLGYLAADPQGPLQPPSAAWLRYTGPLEHPAQAVNLRTIDPERYVIYDVTSRTVLEEIEANMAFYEIYDGAIYLYQGKPYHCESVNMDTKVARVRRAHVKWYTKVRDLMDVHVTGGQVAYPTAAAALHAIHSRRGQGPPAASPPGAAAAAPSSAVAPVQGAHRPGPPSVADGAQLHGQGCSCCLHTASAAAADTSSSQAAGAAGPGSAADGVPSSSTVDAGAFYSPPQCETCVVSVRFMGYFRVWQGTGEVFDAVELFLPDAQYETQAAYMRLPPSARAACEAAGIPFREGVHAAQHALLNVVPLFMVCNPGDMATECDNPYDTRYRPERLILFDKQPGGIGLAAQATPLFPELCRRALQLVSSCPCPYPRGCPACVQHLECKNYNAVISKKGALLVLQAMVAAQEAADERASTAAAAALQQRHDAWRQAAAAAASSADGAAGGPQPPAEAALAAAAAAAGAAAHLAGGGDAVAAAAQHLAHVQAPVVGPAAAAVPQVGPGGVDLALALLGGGGAPPEELMNNYLPVQPDE